MLLWLWCCFRFSRALSTNNRFALDLCFLTYVSFLGFLCLLKDENVILCLWFALFRRSANNNVEPKR